MQSIDTRNNQLAYIYIYIYISSMLILINLLIFMYSIDACN